MKKFIYLLGSYVLSSFALVGVSTIVKKVKDNVRTN